MKKAVQSTFTSSVVSDIGGFGGLYAPEIKDMDGKEIIEKKELLVTNDVDYFQSDVNHKYYSFVSIYGYPYEFVDFVDHKEETVFCLFTALFHSITDIIHKSLVIVDTQLLCIQYIEH